MSRAQAKMDAAALAQEEAKAATAAASRAADAAGDDQPEHLARAQSSTSRKTQRLYIRRGNVPVFESPVAARSGEPIGTFVFTALITQQPTGRMRWNVVSMYKDATNIDLSEAKRESKKHRQTKPADVAGAQLALDRLDIPREALDRISEVLLPGSSLIVSDEASDKTGKDTDFIVFMSGEPHGGIATRPARSQPRRTTLATGSCHAGKEGRQVRLAPGPEFMQPVRRGETGDTLLSRHSLAFECNLACPR